MKKSCIRLLTCVTAAILFLTAVVACGPKQKDWTNVTYEQYQAEDWTSKTIAYQFSCISGKDGAYAYWFPLLVNLYSDGSMAAFHRSNPEDVYEFLPGYEAEHVMDLHLGYWTEADGTINMQTQRNADSSINKCSVKVSDGDMSFPFIISFGGVYELEYTVHGGKTVQYPTLADFVQQTVGLQPDDEPAA